MILWNYWISFGNALTKQHDRIDQVRSTWKYTKEEAEKAMEHDLQAIISKARAVYIEDCGVYPKDIHNLTVYEGVLDIESDYEYLDLLINGHSMYKEIFEPYEGLRAKITLEIIPE